MHAPRKPRVSVAPDASGLSPYDLELTPSYACQADERFSYCLYVPKSIRTAGPSRFRLLVAMHDSRRNNQSLRSSFAELAVRNRCVVLAPLFPCGILEKDDRDNFKYIQFHDIRFDFILLSMVEEVSAKFGLPAAPFLLYGFSGGAHFAHRFYFLHPERLAAVSIAAPGSVTLLDTESDWWVGVRNVRELFGRELDYRRMAQVPVQLVVGELDIDDTGIVHTPQSRHWMPGANDAGINRIERLRQLGESLSRRQIPVHLDIIEGVGHNDDALAARAVRFFEALPG